MKCRFCENNLSKVFVDLINSPPSNSYLKFEELVEPEVYYPLKIFVCESCLLVQIDEYKKSEDIFNKEYAYFSSYSTSWLEHSEKYVNYMIDRFEFNQDSEVVEIASNDGYLLQYFKEKNVPVLGVEPTGNTADVAIEKGIETIKEFFGEEFAEVLKKKGRGADLIIGNNVLAHVPDINDFVAGMKVLLNEQGIITMEFPHLLNLIELNQFDTIYHEHFSYLSFSTVSKIFANKGLEMFDVQEISTHGGSLRIFAKHKNDDSKEISENVYKLLEKEEKKGMLDIDFYTGFDTKVNDIKVKFLEFLIKMKKEGKVIAAYGAAAKGNTLLNYCGIKNDLIDFVVDASPYKQNLYLPGSHIPVVDVSYIENKKPDYIIILPWNLKDEISSQLSYVKDWGCKFVVAIPSLEEF